jgi:hypothetical protein
MVNLVTSHLVIWSSVIGCRRFAASKGEVNENTKSRNEIGAQCQMTKFATLPFASQDASCPRKGPSPPEHASISTLIFSRRATRAR